MTFIWFSLARNWILNGPVMSNSAAMRAAIRLIRRTVSTYSRWAGKTIVASPEWTPANSICSLMAEANSCPWSATASNSISLQRVMKRLTTTGCSCDTSAAILRQRSKLARVWHTFIAAPESTYEGRTKIGNPTRATKASKSAILVTSAHSGWSIPKASTIELNLCRSSARSIFSADVPRMRMPKRCKGNARLLGI